MKLYVCTDFEGHYPVGTSAVVIAKTKEQAEKLLLKELDVCGLPQKSEICLQRIPRVQETVVILNDGNY